MHGTSDTPAPRVPGTGPRIFQVGSRPLFRCMGADLGLEKQGPLPKAINHPVESPSRQSPMEGGLAGVWLVVGEGGVQGPSPGCWPQPFGTHASQRPLLSFPGLCPTQALARKRQAEPGRPPQDLGGLPGANEAIYTSGHSPTKQYVFKRFLPK